MYTWADFVRLAANSGKRLCTCDEYLRAAQGNDFIPTNGDIEEYIALTLSPTGTTPKAISYYNVRDLVGNVWKITKDISMVETSNLVYTKSAFAVGGLYTVGSGATAYQTADTTISYTEPLWGITDSCGAWLVCDAL